MAKYLLLCLLLRSITGVSVHGSEPGLADFAAHLLKAGLVSDGSSPAPDDARNTVENTVENTVGNNDKPDDGPDQSKSCANVSFTRGLKYGESDLNILDVATGDIKATSPRPVLLFVTGDSFSGDAGATDVAGPLQDEAMCFAARNGMVGVKISYRRAPAYPWPSGARDVAAALSWVHQNIDLFGGSPDEVVTIGFSTGAFHVASLLAHPEFQERDSAVAGAVLVSGIYRSSADAGATEKSYFGMDAGKYEERSAFPGILNIETPILLAWSVDDPPRLVAQGEKLKELLCHSATHCPRVTVLKNRDSLPSVLEADTAGASLAEPLREMVREIEARGLP
ncbi:alpha/beta hydrolase [Bradyrhizobium sp.]|jgi:acetyl esterase/lipase|uniref:alpha/beta hydrolase n=1 Tax=Bradyrhizobium sp. TaxID=376 RepID=UPI003D131BA5